METSVLTLTVSAKTKNLLEKLAEDTDRSESMLAVEAIERYLEVEDWRVKEIKQAIKEADAGDFVSEKELEKVKKKYAA
jgi:RHH-type rel operon transcriptional repressor/antitoxin RelB